MNIADHVFVITGSGRGLGRAIALQLAKLHGTIAVVDINDQHIAETVALCQAAGGRAAGFHADIASESDVVQLIASIHQEFGRIDGWINNAGITRDGLLVKAKDGAIISVMSLDDWNLVLKINLTGVFLCSREIASYWVQHQQQGVLINISSISRHGNIGQSNYVASKAAVASLTVTWAKELIRYGIRVAAIAPGYIQTEMTQAIKPEALEKIISQIPMKRMGLPEEIAHTVQYIVENDYVHGRVIECDGGLRI